MSEAFLAGGGEVKITTHLVYPPIPIRDFDWQATADDYEPGQPCGWGETEQDAIADLLEQIEDLLEERIND